MSLIDQYHSKYQFNEVHTIKVKGSKEKCYVEALNVDLNKSIIVRILFSLRGLPFRRTKLREITADSNFTLIEENYYDEFLYGFFYNGKVIRVNNKEEFKQNLSTKYSGKAVWSFSFSEEKDGVILVKTETRVLCFSRKAKNIFSLYWFFIKPFSGLIRIILLKLIKKGVE